MLREFSLRRGMVDAPLRLMLPRRFRMVIAVDRSEYAEIVLEHGLDQAARHDSPDVHVLAVAAADAEVDSMQRWLAATVLDDLDAFRTTKPGWQTRLHVRVGDAAEEITNLAGEIEADLLVIGHYGLHHPRRSTADDVLATVTCPALIVGLAGREIEAQPQCPECVAVRAETDAERWFCARHRDPDRVHLSFRVPIG